MDFVYAFTSLEIKLGIPLLVAAAHHAQLELRELGEGEGTAETDENAQEEDRTDTAETGAGAAPPTFPREYCTTESNLAKKMAWVDYWAEQQKIEKICKGIETVHPDWCCQISQTLAIPPIHGPGNGFFDRSNLVKHQHTQQRQPSRDTPPSWPSQPSAPLGEQASWVEDLTHKNGPLTEAIDALGQQLQRYLALQYHTSSPRFHRAGAVITWEQFITGENDHVRQGASLEAPSEVDAVTAAADDTTGLLAPAPS